MVPYVSLLRPRTRKLHGLVRRQNQAADARSTSAGGIHGRRRHGDSPLTASPPSAPATPAAEESSNPEEGKAVTEEEQEGKEEQLPPEDPSACVDTIQSTPSPPEGPGVVDSQEGSKEPERTIATRRKARGRAGNNTGQGESGSRNPEGPS